jgi:hypothetical protein
MPKSSVAAGAVRQGVHDHDPGLDHGRNHQLGDTITALDGERVIAKVNQNDAQLAPIIRVYRPRRVRQRDPVTKGQPRAWTHLNFKARGDLEGETRGHQNARTPTEHNRLDRGRYDIHPCCSRRHITGEREVAIALWMKTLYQQARGFVQSGHGLLILPRRAPRAPRVVTSESYLVGRWPEPLRGSGRLPSPHLRSDARAHWRAQRCGTDHPYPA